MYKGLGNTMRILTDGFEDGTFSKFHGYAGNPTISTSSPRISGRRASVSTLTAKLNNITQFYTRFAYLISSSSLGNAERFSVRTTTGIEVLRLHWGENIGITAFRGAETTPFDSSPFLRRREWELFEIHYNYTPNSSSGNLQIIVNGVMVLDSNTETKPTTVTDTTLDFIDFGGGTLCSIDDIAINDTHGSEDNSWCGDGHVVALVPSADVAGSIAFDRQPTTTAGNFNKVNEIPANTTNWVESDQPNEVDLYETTDFAFNASDDIQRVWITSTARLLTADATSQLSLGYKLPADAQPTWVTNLALGIDYRIYHSPSFGQEWTPTQANTLQIGIRTVNV
jgi:hypothetical protein